MQARSCLVRLCAVVLTFVAAPALYAQSRTEFDLDLPSQSLAASLRAVGSQTSTNVLFDPPLVEGRDAPALKAELTADLAFERLLAGTGLEHRFIDEKTVVVAAAEGVAAEDAAGSAEEEGGPDPGNGRTTSTLGRMAQASREERSKRTEEEESQGQQGTDASKQSDIPIEEIVVTGTNIRGAVPVGSPFSIYTRDDIEQSGAATLDQFARQMPQNLGSVDGSTFGLANTGAGFSQLGNNATFGAGFNINGLGPGATLTLLNGHRISAAGADGQFADISLIPLSAIDRVEVLTDGASAIYGADAIAGVVNLVLRKSYDGAETSVRYGAANGGAEEFTTSQLLGKTWSDGNVLLVYEHDSQEGLWSSKRDFVPPQPVPILLLPEQNRNSLFLAGRQELGANTALSADLLLSDRDYETENSVSLIRQELDGSARQAGGALFLEYQLGSDWLVNTGLNYSSTSQSAFFRQPMNDLSGITNVDTNLAGFTLRTDGPVLRLPGGTVKAAIGVDLRREEFERDFVVDRSNGRTVTDGGLLERRVSSVFGEIFLPLVGVGNQRPWVRSLELSVAARYDEYDDFGSTTNPKVGVEWGLSDAFRMKVAYGTSFKPPLLVQLATAPGGFVTFNLADPPSPTGTTATLIDQRAGNPGLQPEESSSLNVGFEWKPGETRGLVLTASYFEIEFEDRVGRPPLVGSILDVLTQPSLVPFIDRSPDLGFVQAAYAIPGFPNLAGVAPEEIGAIFDFRLQNIALSKHTGLQFDIGKPIETSRGDVDISLGGTYITDYDFQSTMATEPVSLVNRIGEPVDLRLRGVLSWQNNGLGAVLTLNHTDAYENNFLSLPTEVQSWTTANLQFSYAFDHSPLQGLTATLSIRNVTDEEPPFVAVPGAGGFRNVGYDSTNASPLGRFVALQFAYRW